MGKFTKRFTEDQERAILSQFFTNPHGDVSFFITRPGFGPEEQAALAARYSRDPEPYQKKFLKLLERDVDMEYVNALVADPSIGFHNPLMGERARKASEKFHTQWSLGVMDKDDWKDKAIRGYGHGSIKDGANVGYHIEGLAEIHTKVITAQPTNRPQVASTRYIEWEDIISAAEHNVDIAASPFSEKIINLTQKMMEAYGRFTDIGEEFVSTHTLNREFQEQVWLHPDTIEADVRKWMDAQIKKDAERTFSDEEIDKRRERVRSKREKDWRKYARKTCLDSTRALLLPSLPTYMACSTDDTTLERDITRMLSHPMQSVQDLGAVLKSEASKIMPALIGNYTHAQRSEHDIDLRKHLMHFVQGLDVAKGSFEDPGRVHRVGGVKSYHDPMLAAAVAYPYCHNSFEQLYAHFAKNPTDVQRIVDIMLAVRKEHDPQGFMRDADELMHGGHMKETLINWGADRDMVRHRRQHKTRQLLSTHHGYEMPPLLEAFGLTDEFKRLMATAKEVYDAIHAQNPWTAQYVVPFAFKVRRLYSSQVAQDLFIARLRSGEGGHPSYRDVAWRYEDLNREVAPEFSRLFRVNRTTYPAELINLKEARAWYNEHKRGRE